MTFPNDQRAQPALGLLWFSTALGDGGFPSKMRQIEDAPLIVPREAIFQVGQTSNPRPFLQSGKELPQAKGASRDSGSEPSPG